MRTFVDTNVLFYLHDGRDPVKRERAIRTLRSLPGASVVLSTQVLVELYTTLTRKLSPPMEPDDALAVIERWARYRVVSTDAALVLAGLKVSIKHQLSSWDGLIVAAAASAGCDQLLTEDVHAGATYEGVTVVNPFA